MMMKKTPSVSRVLLAQLLLLFIIIWPESNAQIDLRGPPQASRKEIKKISRIGDTVKLTCPISGFPSPIVEWQKNGEKIDYMWDRHRTYRKSLKIRHVDEDDTGIFTCKGINGFGSEEVRIELIVVDPKKLPSSLLDHVDVAPPVMTYETRISALYYLKSVGDTFKVSCEALGSPQPEIFWFKDGQHIDEAVHYQKGKSILEFSVLGTADAGLYTCRARNLLGEAMQNFTLEVKQPVGSTHAIVTEAGPVNSSVFHGDTASLQCRVKSLAPPHIKWLKRMEPHEVSAENTLRVSHERYRILESSHDVPTGNDEYLNKLVISNASPSDTGMYICFVTNSGFGALTYKSMHLSVIPKSKVDVPDIRVPHTGTGPGKDEPLPVLILVICLALTVLVLLVIIVICVVRKKSKEDVEADEEGRGGHNHSEPNTPDLHRSYVLLAQNQASHLGLYTSGKMLHKPVTLPLPPPPPPPTPPPPPPTYMLHPNQWTSAVYPKDSCGQVQPKLVSLAGPDSGYTDLDNSKESVNLYEVPYAHLLASSGRQSLATSAAQVKASAATSGSIITSRSGPIPSSSCFGIHSNGSNSSSNNNPNGVQYYSDYNS